LWIDLEREEARVLYTAVEGSSVGEEGGAAGPYLPLVSRVFLVGARGAWFN